MSQVFWQAKIWGLLHDPALKSLHDNSGRGGNSSWRDLAVMQDWVSRDWNPEEQEKDKQVEALKYIGLADHIASASDRGAIGSLSHPVDYDENGLEVSHLLSEAKLPLKLTPKAHQGLLQSGRAGFLKAHETTLFPEAIKRETDPRKVFWWLWRCLPKAASKKFANDESLLLMPAETRLPDSSIWSHASITSALAGSLAGYNLKVSDIENWSKDKASRPYLATFTFTPVQELIKASTLRQK